MEKVIYTRTWASGLAKDLSRDFLRSALFALFLLIGLACLFGTLIALDGIEEGSTNDSGLLSILIMLGCVIAAFLAFVFWCWLALFVVANDRFWGIPETTLTTIWEEREQNWISSTVAFSHYLESQGKTIEVSLVRYNDIRRTAHRMIDTLDDRTLNLYLSLLSAVKTEKQRIDAIPVQVRKIGESPQSRPDPIA